MSFLRHMCIKITILSLKLEHGTHNDSAKRARRANKSHQFWLCAFTLTRHKFLSLILIHSRNPSSSHISSYWTFSFTSPPIPWYTHDEMMIIAAIAPSIGRQMGWDDGRNVQLADVKRWFFWEQRTCILACINGRFGFIVDSFLHFNFHHHTTSFKIYASKLSKNSFEILLKWILVNDVDDWNRNTQEWMVIVAAGER